MTWGLPDPKDAVQDLVRPFAQGDFSEELKSRVRTLEDAVRGLLLAGALAQQKLKRAEEERDDAVYRHDEQVCRLRELGVGAEELLARRLAPQVESLRQLWAKLADTPRPGRVALAVLHGIAEASAHRYPFPDLTQFFNDHRERIEKGTADPVVVEEKAFNLGLPVCLAGRCPVAIEAAHFGYVEEADVNKVRVALLDERDEDVQCVVNVPYHLLPPHYRSDGSGVAWVVRRYENPPQIKGRFEPASNAP
jgi:hypothetical protein